MTFFHDIIDDVSRFLKNINLNELYISLFLRNLAGSIINIFVPVFLYQLGFSLGEIALFFLVSISFMLFLFPLGFFLATKIGVKHLMGIGTLLLLSFYLMMPSVEHGLFYLLPALIQAASFAFFWSGFHARVTQSLSKNNAGSQLSLFQIVSILAMILGPLIGALFIFLLSFTFAFVMAAFLMLLSLVPLMLTKEYYLDKALRLKDFLSHLTPKRLLGHIGEGIEDYTSVILWPLFIFVVVQGVLSLGFIVSLSALPLVWYLWFVGKRVDAQPNKVLRLGVFSSSFITVLYPFILNPVGLFIMNFFNKVINQTIFLSFQNILYTQAKKSISYIYFREVFLGLGRIIVLLVLFVSNSFFVTFFFAALGTLLCLCLVQKNRP